MSLASTARGQTPDGVASYRMLIYDEWVEARREPLRLGQPKHGGALGGLVPRGHPG
ncbi:MAG: hypothetical protein ACRDTR_22855 [Rubrobacter sp.]